MSQRREFLLQSARLMATGAAFTLAGATAACGADSSSGKPLEFLSNEDAAAFSKLIEKTLASKGARVAIVFRLGRRREDMPKGMSYTHGAFWVYREITTNDGIKLQGYAIYNLYHGDGVKLARDKSYLHQDWPIDFVRGSAVDDVAFIIPNPEMQRRILGLIDTPDYAALHNPEYSLIANPLSSKYQNCNSFMLDVIAAAAWQTTDKAKIRANLRKYYTPSIVDVPAWQRVIGPKFDIRVKTDDQKGKLMTAAYESMADFMKKYKLLQESGSIFRAVPKAEAPK